MGRLDISCGGDAEILIAVDRSIQQCGVGSFVLGQLEAEASRRGLNYVYNTIREHDQREYVHDWLFVRGFRGPLDGDLRKRVVGRAAPSPDGVGVAPATRLEPADRALAPGHEDQGGYVDVEQHQY